MLEEDTTIRLKRKTRERLAQLGTKDESFDDIVQRLIDFYKKNNRTVADRKAVKKMAGGTE